MDKPTLAWAAFVAILCPLFLRQASDPVLQTVIQVAACLVMVAIADLTERRAP